MEARRQTVTALFPFLIGKVLTKRMAYKLYAVKIQFPFLIGKVLTI